VNRFPRVLVPGLLGLSILSALLAACGGGDGSGPEPLPPTTAPAAGTLGDGRLPQLVEWARGSQNAPAMGAIIIRNGQVVERAVAGVRSTASSVPVTIEDQWHLGSITKSMTSTLAAILVEDGLITWDATPAQVWPGSVNAMHADFRNVTLRQFLSHTSGMKRDDEYSAAEDNAPGTVMQKRQAWAIHLLGTTPAQPAGTEAYSNMGYVVAGAMLEARAATPWETLMTTRLFAPIGMTHSGFGAPGTPGALDQPLGHWSRDSGFEPVPLGPGADNPQALGPAGGVHSTLDDLAKYLLAHMNGERGTPGLLSVDSFRMLHTPVVPDYALGWNVVAVVGSSEPGFAHAGTNLRWFAHTWFAPSRNLAVLLVTNGGGDRGEAAISALNSVVRDRIEATP